MNNMIDALEHIAAYPRSRSEEMSIGTAREIARTALASQAQQESKQGCKECDGQTYIHSPTGEYLGECPFCTKEEEPYAYDVPTKDGTELAYAIYFNKYNNPLPEGAIPLYASQKDHIPNVGKMVQSQSQQESQWFMIATAPKNKKIIVTYKNALGKNRTVFAKYIEKFTEESTLDTECETDYCEEDDTFYLKEGWVELIDNWDEFSSVYFDSQNVPTHWMDIPPAPEGDKP